MIRNICKLLILLWLVPGCTEPAKDGSEAATNDSKPTVRSIVTPGKQPTRTTSTGEVNSGSSAVVLPDNFQIATPNPFVNSLSFEASWTKPKDLVNFDVVLSPSKSCLVPIDSAADYEKTSITLKVPTATTYYLCVQAILKNGRLLNADNSPYAITIDLVPPGSSTLDTITTPARVKQPTITWSKNEDLDTYDLLIGRDPKCEVIEQTKLGLTDTTATLEALGEGSFYACLDTVDPAGNHTAATNTGLNFVIDTAAPSIITAKSTTQNGSYKANDTIDIALTFNETVYLVSAAGFVEGNSPLAPAADGTSAVLPDPTTSEPPTLLLDTGLEPASATYISGQGTDTLTFRYQILDGHRSKDLDLADVSKQIILGNWELTDLAANAHQEYSLRIHSDNKSLAENSDLVIDAILPSAPTILYFAADTSTGSQTSFDNDTSFFLRWSGSSDAHSGLSGLYAVELFQSADCTGTPILNQNVTGSFLQFDSGIHGESYSFQVRSFDKSGNESIASGCAPAIQVDTVAPSIATSLYMAPDSSADAASLFDNDNNVFLRFTPGNDATSGFKSSKVSIFAGENCTGSPVKTATLVNLSSYQFVGSDQSSYSFLITSEDEAGNTSNSACSAKFTLDAIAPSAPSVLKTATDSASGANADFDDDTDIFFVWSASTDASSGVRDYTLNYYSQENCQGAATSQSGLTGTSWNLVGGTENISYSFKVVSYDNSGNSSTSDCSSSIKIDVTSPSTPNSLITSADALTDPDVRYDDDTSVYFSWAPATDSISGIRDYTLNYYALANCAGAATVISGITATNYTLNGVNSTTYSFKVKSNDLAGNSSSLSSCSGNIQIDTDPPASATTLVTAPDAPSDPNSNYDDDVAIYFAWTAGSDAISGLNNYTVRRYSQGNCGGSATDTTGVTANSLAYSGVNASTYSFKIITYDNAGNFSTSPCSGNIMIDTVSPATATTLITTQSSPSGSDSRYDTDGNIYFAWTAGAEAESGIRDYTVSYYSLANCGGAASTTSGISDNYLAVSGSDGTTYSFKVTTFDRAGNSSGVTACSPNILIDTVAPTTPTSPAIAADSAVDAAANLDDDTTIYLKWGASADVTSGVKDYEISYYSLGNCSGPSSLISGITTNSYAFSGSSGTTYSFKVKAYDQAGNASTQTACSNSLLIDATAPVGASNLKVAADVSNGPNAAYDDDTSIYLTWSAGSDSYSGLRDYTVNYYTAANCSGPASDISGTTSLFEEITAVNGTTYSFKVVTYDIAGNSTTSSCSSNILIDTDNPAVATNLTTAADSAGGGSASYDDDTNIYLAWTASIDPISGVRDYTVAYYAQSNCGGSAITVSEVTASSYLVSGVSGTSYSFKINSFDNAGNSSGWSSCSGSIMIDTSPPTGATSPIIAADAAGGPSANYDDDTSIYFAWTAGSDADSGLRDYTIRYYTQSNCGGSGTDISGVSGTSYLYSGTNGTTYSFRVLTYDNAGNFVTSGCSDALMIDTDAPSSATSLVTAPDSASDADSRFDNDVTAIYFAWTASTDAISGVKDYTLHYYTQALCQGASTVVNNLTSSNYQLSNPIDSTTYSFKVTTYDYAGNSTASSCSGSIIPDVTAPGNPSNLITAKTSGADTRYSSNDSLFFGWTAGAEAGSGIIGNTIRIYTWVSGPVAACTGSTQTLNNITGTEYNKTSAVDGKYYSFKVISTTDNSGNVSSASPCSGLLLVDLTNPSSPSSLRIAADDQNGAHANLDDDANIYFAWDAASDSSTDTPSGIRDYTIEYYTQTGCGGAATAISGIAATSYLFSGVDGTTYSFKVTAFDNASNSAISSCSSDLRIDTTPPTGASSLYTAADTVGGPNANYDDDLEFFFDWTAGNDTGGSGLRDYTLRYYTQANCSGSPTDVTGISTTDYTFNGSDGTTYSYKIITYDNAGNSTTSACSGNIIVDVTPPTGASSLVTAADANNGSNVNYDDDTTIYFAWQAGSDSASGLRDYTVRRYAQTNCGGAATDVTGVTANYVQFIGTTATSYSFKIVTYDNAGNSTTSGCSGNILIDTDAPSTPTSLKIPADDPNAAGTSYDNDTTIYFAWAASSDSPSGVKDYTVSYYAQSNCGGSATQVSGIAGNSYEFLTGTDGTSYSFKVTAYDYAGNASPISSCSSSLMIDTTAPGTPTSLVTAQDSAAGANASYDNDTTIYFVWTPGAETSSGIRDYTVTYYDAANCSGSATTLTGITTTNQSITGSNGTTYSFKVKTYDNATNVSSDSTCSGNITIDTTPPPAFSITAPTSLVTTDLPTVTWNGEGDAATWDLYIDNESSCIEPYVTSQSYTSLGSANKVLTTALVDGTYYVCVFAHDAAGNTTAATQNGTYTFQVETSVLHISYTTFSGGNYGIHYAMRSGNSWTLEQVANGGTNVIDPHSSLALDSANIPRLTYSQESSSLSTLKYTSRTGGSWSAPSTLDTADVNDSIGLHNSIALDSSDKVHISYLFADDSANKSLVRYISDSSGSFPATGTTIQTVSSLTSVLDTSLAIDSQTPNVVHVIATYLESGKWTLRYRNNLTSWAAGTDEIPNNLPANTACDEYYYATIAVDASHNPHLAYLCHEGASNSCTIYYATKSGANWSHTSLGNVMGASCLASLDPRHRPSITLDGNGKAYVAWLDDDTNAVMYRTNVSGSWAAAVSADSSNAAVGDCTITLDDDKIPYIFFRDNSQTLKLTTSNSGSWVTESSGASNVTGLGTGATTGIAGRSNR